MFIFKDAGNPPPVAIPRDVIPQGAIPQTATPQAAIPPAAIPVVDIGANVSRILFFSYSIFKIIILKKIAYFFSAILKYNDKYQKMGC